MSWSFAQPRLEYIYIFLKEQLLFFSSEENVLQLVTQLGTFLLFFANFEKEKKLVWTGLERVTACSERHLVAI